MASIIEASIQNTIAQALTISDSAASHAKLNAAFDELQKLKADNAFLGSEGEGDSAHITPDLVLVLCEAAITARHTTLAKKCLVALLQGSTTTRSFQIRAVFCQAQVEASEAENLRGDRLVQATVDSLMKVVQGMKIALQDVSELSSLLYRGAQYVWSISRGLFREGTYATIVSALGFVVYCLEAVEFTNWTERIGWMMRYAIALDGCGRHSEAAAYLTKTAETAAKVAPHLSHAIYKIQVVNSVHCPNPKFKADAAKGILKPIYASQAFLCGLLNDKAQADVELIAAFEEWKHEATLAEEAAKRLEDIPPMERLQQQANKKQVKGGSKTGRKGAAQGGPTTKEELDAENIIRDDALGDLGISFMLNGQLDYASQCADLMDKSKQLKVRVFGEFIRVYNEVDKYGGFAVQDALHASSIPADMINKLVTSVRKVERSLESAVRVDPARDRTYATEVGCVLLWKIVLPLLQENTRKHIARSLHYAAKSLDDTSSNMNELRVLLHYESSICDADEEYLNKATIRIDKALSIDYTPSQEECQLYSLDRPLDRLIVWSKRRLETKANLYKKHTNPVDEALLIIEQSRDAPVNSRISMLTRAMSSLQASEPPLDYFIESPPSSPVASPSPLDATKLNKSQKGGGSVVKTESSSKQPPKGDRSGTVKVETRPPRPLDLETEKRRSLLRDRANVWNLVMTYGWQEHNIRQVDVVTHAAERILERVWTRSGDRDMRIMQAQAHITLVQTQSVELQSKGLRVGQISFMEDDDSDLDEPTKIGASSTSRHHGGGDSALATEIAEKMATVATATKSVKEHISAAAQIAKDLILEGWPEEWLLINVGVLLWNTFLPSFLDNDFISASESLEVVFPMLMDPTSGIDAKSETSLFQDLGHAYAQSLLQHHLLSQTSPDDEMGTNPVNILKVAQLPLRRVSMTVDPNSAYLQSAASICEQCISALRTPMDAKNFLLLAPTIRRFLGPAPVEPLPAPSRAYPQQQLLMYIDELAFPQITAEQRNALVPRCLDLLTEDPNVELCARLSEVVLDTHPKAAARIAIIGRGLQSAGKLGIRQDERKMFLIGQSTGALPQRAGSKEGTKDKKRVKDDQSVALAEQEALDAAVAALPVPDATPMDWMWYSLLLQFQAAATVMLINPALQEKRTQFEIRIQALSVLAESSTAALHAPKQFSATNVMKNMRHYHQISEEIANDPTWRHLTYDSVATMMSGKLLAACVPLSVVKPHPSAPSDADVMSGLMLMLLGILTDTNRIDEGLALMKVAIGTLPASHHRPFWSLDIQIRCEGGLPTQQTLLRVKEFSAEMQAQAWLSLCRHSPDPKDQMYAYQKAVDVLKDSTTERAEVMVSMAQWALSSNAPMTLEEVRTMILAAIDSVVDECDIDPNPSGHAWGDQHSELGGHLSDVQSVAGRSSVQARSVAPRSIASPSIARSAVSHSTAPGGVNKKKGASVRQLLILAKAYYVLAKIGGQRPVHCLGLLVDARSAFRMFTHICLTLWHNTVSCANEHVRRQAARVERREVKSQMIAQKTTTSNNRGGSTPRDDKSKKPSSAKSPRAAPVARFPDPVELPSQCEDWITFVIPSTLVSTLQEVTVDAAVGPASIGDASQLVGLLRDAIQDMASLGLEWECAPVLSLSELVIRLTSPPLASDPCGRAAAIENHFTRWDLCYRLRLGASALPVSSLQPMPSGTERAALMEDARLVEQRHGQVRRKKGPGVSPVSLPTVGLPKTPIHVFWVSIASHLVAQGRIGQACDVLQDARYHARAYRDARSFAQCNLLDAQIARLEGRFADSIQYAKITADLRLDSEGDCVWEDSVPVEMVAQAVTLIAESYVQLHDLDMAFKTIYGLVQNLKGWIAPKKGLWKDVAHLATPFALCTSISTFAQVVLDAVARHDMLNRANPKRERKQGSSELVASSSEAVMHVGRLLSEISPLMYHCPQQESAVLFLETRINEIHANECLHAGNARDSKTSLQMEAKALLEAISSLKVQISGLGEQRGLMQPGNPNEAATPSTAALAQVFAALGDNILRRVKLNSLLLDDLRQSTLSRVAAPTVEGAPAELHGEVVKFMRSSKKQRDANKRKNSRLAKRDELEAIRSQKREDRQAEVERQRELRKQDELLTAALSPPGPVRKDIKRRASKTRRDTVETVVPQQEAIPDIDPEDKCGIDSIATSSDSGLDEDNQSDEEEEMVLALKGLPDAEVEARITFGDALVYFTQAQELLGTNRAGVSRTEEDIMLRMGRCLMLMEEAAIIAQDQRSAVVAGDEPPLLSASPTIEAKWAAPIEVPSAEEELRKVGSVVTKKDDKNTAKRTGGNNTARDGAMSAMSASPATAPSSSQYPSLLNSVLSMRRVSSNRAAQGTTFLASSALAAHHTGALVPLASAMLELANSAVLLGEPDVAGVCLEYAQAASTSNFVHALWSDVATPDTPEASLIRLVDEVERRAPHLCESPHFHGILKLVHLHSPMSVRLSLPEPTFLRALAPDSVVEKSFADTSLQLPSDVCVVSLNIVEPTSSRYVCILMSVRRPNSPFIIRRAQIPTEEFYKLIQRRRQISMQRRSQLSSMGSASAATQGKVEAAFVQYVEDTEAALNPLLNDLFMPLNAIASRCQLFICAHPTLSPLPFEALEPFNRFRSVSRDLSVFTVNQRLLRRDAEGNKLNTNHSIMVVDPYAENDGLSHQAIYGDVRPRVSSWVTVGSIIDSDGFSRPVQKEALIAALTHPSSAALVANMAGKLTSLISLPEVASLSLEHLRAAFLFDSSVLEKALRRESQQNMTKSPQMLMYESNSWYMPLLMLARGVDYCVTNSMPASASFNDFISRTAVASLERTTVSFTDTICACIGREPGMGAGTPGAGGSEVGGDEVPISRHESPLGTRTTSVLSRGGAHSRSMMNTPLQGSTFSALERFGLLFYGLSPVDDNATQQTTRK